MNDEAPRVWTQNRGVDASGGIEGRLPSQPRTKGPTMSHASRRVLIGSVVLLFLGCATTGHDDRSACVDVVAGGLRAIASDPASRFVGKVHEQTARCRGGDRAVAWRGTPWTDWQSYWATADTASLVPGWS